MDYRRRFKRLYLALTVCWIGVCSIGGIIAVSSAHGLRAYARPLAPRNLLKDLTGSEYEALRQSYFFRNLAGVLIQAGHSVSAATDSLIADVEIQDQPEEFGVIARLLATNKADVLAWLAITAFPPILVYILAFVAFPRIAGGFKSGQQPSPR
jgi:hypothetical protein